MHFYILLLVSSFATMHVASGADKVALRFQSTKIPSNESRAFTLFDPDSEVSLKSFSIAVWFKVEYFRDVSYITSYTTSNALSNLLNMYLRHDIIGVAIQSKKKKILRNKIAFTTGTWYHMVSTVDETEKIANVYVNGELEYSYKITTHYPLILNGSFILGQEADAFNGGFVAEQSFCGLMTEFNFYSRVLNSTDIESLMSCSGAESPEGDVLAWSSTQWTLVGDVLEELTDRCDVIDDPFVILPNRMAIPLAKETCRGLFKSDLYLPKTNETNIRLYNESIQYVQNCRPLNHAKAFLWIGATDRKVEGKWTDFKENELNFTDFVGSGKVASEDCAVMEIPPSGGKWNDIFCTNMILCVPCSVPKIQVHLNMRGFCERRVTHTLFKIGEVGQGLTRNIEGIGKYVITYNESSETWHLENIWESLLVATFFSHDHNYPVGKKEWILEADYALCGEKRGSSYTLVLSTCTADEFTCDDGYCIPLEERCDLRAQCPDLTDETGCYKLIPPENYIVDLPPAGLESALEINALIIIERFIEIDVREMKYTIDFIVSLTWRDSRLTFANLNTNHDINMIRTEDVWVPEFEFMNANFPDVHMQKSQLSVLQESMPMSDDISRSMRDNLYEGDSNSLYYKIRVNAPFVCEMNLQLFPFDYQMCQIQMKLKSGRSSIIKWGTLDIKYLGATKLSEYDILPMSTVVGENNEFSLGTAFIPLSRQYAYYVTSAYLPSLMLLFISYASLFCRLDNLDLRVMMTITTLLVLYSLYQQISNGLPKTSYVKAIDIWSFFALTIIFTQIIFHVLIDLEGKFFSRNETVKQDDSFYGDTFSSKTKYKASPRKVRTVKLTRIIYLVIIILFILFYFFYILYRINNPE